jgi:phage tail sheath protein FI
MAFLPSESPGITIKEFDLSGVVPAVTTSTGAIVGNFNWGPVEQPVLVGNEAELVSNFGSPTLSADDSSSVNFLSTAMFLKYSSNLYVCRAVGTGAYNAVDSSTSTTIVKNLDDWNTKKSGIKSATLNYVAKYPGSAGNSLKVSICGTTGLADSAMFTNWAYKVFFDGAPGTSSYVSDRSVDSALALDEVHVAVIDEDGLFSGQPNTVLETFGYVSLATDAKTDDGSNNFVIDVINNKSSYIWCANTPFNDSVDAATWTKSLRATSTNTVSLVGGAKGTALTSGNYQTGFDKFEDVDTIQVDFLIAPGMGTSEDQRSVIADLVSTASTLRKDCVVVASPHRDAVVGVNNPTTITTNIETFANAIAASSYLILDNNYLKVYNKYSDKYVFIPAAAATAGVMAATDNVAAPWYSPAGTRRGQYFGVTSLAWNASKAQRDTLYKANVNPIVVLPGQGILLYGDKTKLGRNSAFSRINVRRLFLSIERAIKGAAQNVMFEFNDEFTRAEFVNIVEPFLREIKGRRGITDFRVVCDETNNTANIIDNNQFVASIFVKPARSINYVTLNFVAVRTGVDFEEVVGLV